MPGPARSRPLTIAQLAELAGVSTATVSTVVNGRAEVAPETRAHIESLIRAHGYRRQRKRAHPAPLIELVFSELDGGYAVEIIRGVERVAHENHLAVVLTELHGRHTPDGNWVEDVLRRRPTGVIAVFSRLTDAQRERLDTRGIPFVLLDPSGDPGHQAPSVGASNWSGGLTATRHLLELGHRRIAVITGPRHTLSSRARLDGYRTALDTAGVPIDPALIREGDFHVESGLAQARRLLRLPDPPTAIFSANDLQAVGVYQAAHDAGLRIPQDLSVVGFDDLPHVRWLIPPLTTVRQPLTAMASTAATMVLQLARDEPPAQSRVELATELVVRGSTAPPPPPPKSRKFRKTSRT